MVLLFSLILILLAPAMPRAAEVPGTLPIGYFKAASPNGTLMVLLSGDAGWGTLEATLAARANAAGIDVVGLDSHSYFFNGSSPERLAADLQALFVSYGKPLHAKRLVLAGYSFGADALPFVWKHLPAQTRGHIALIALVGLQPAANFQISVWEMMNLPAPDDIPVANALPDLPMGKVICVYGVNDAEGCGQPALDKATRVPIPGDHELGRDYDAVASAILARLAAR